MGAGAAVLAAAFAHAQPAATRQGLRPSFEETDQYPRLEAPRRPARRDTRPVGAMPGAGNPDGQPQSYATAPGSGAGTTGFLSTNAKRRPSARRRSAGVAVRAKRDAPSTAPHPARHQRNDRVAGDARGAVFDVVPHHLIVRIIDHVLDGIENRAAGACRETSQRRHACSAARAAAQSAAAHP